MKLTLPQRCLDALNAHLDPSLFKALCDPRRIAIVARLATAGSPISVSEVSADSSVHISGVSRHLSQLRDAGVVKAVREGREVFYELNATSLVATLRSLADALEQCCMVHGCCGVSTKEK